MIIATKAIEDLNNNMEFGYLFQYSQQLCHYAELIKMKAMKPLIPMKLSYYFQ